MTGPTPYLQLPGTARKALAFYADVFGGNAQVHTLAEMGRTDGPADAVAHGYLHDGPVRVYASDTVGDEAPFAAEGLMLALLGTADAQTLHGWFARLAEGGVVLDPSRSGRGEPPTARSWTGTVCAGSSATSTTSTTSTTRTVRRSIHDSLDDRRPRRRRAPRHRPVRAADRHAARPQGSLTMEQARNARAMIEATKGRLALRWL
ncbi:hypothetical protein GCM10025865_00120 [Paraoerskovia sediminicola]|uniref:VOC family protein n=1 Tax=Paraoerskovia sediminicola TaxID=1138587 RepID=A0ABN6X9D6_9CELL|nr:hypothetical protein GCM10025865_00120 [Paraoerskovia sediminicola]